MSPDSNATPPTTTAIKKPRSIKNKPRFDDAKEAYGFLRQHRSRKEISTLVAAVQTGAAVAQAFAALPTIKALALALTTPTPRPTTYVPTRPTDEGLRALVESATAIVEMITTMQNLVTPAVVGVAETLLGRSHLKMPAKRLASLVSETMVMAVFAVRTAVHMKHSRIEPAEMDALVQLAGVRDPSQEFAADPRRRRQRTLVWKTTLSRARALSAELPKT